MLQGVDAMRPTRKSGAYFCLLPYIRWCLFTIYT
jgi:hypothetical protein